MFQSSAYEIIPLSFYEGDDVVNLSRQLIGKYLFHQSEMGLTVGKIVETEAYNGRTDQACHAFHRRTPRTEVMYQNGGCAYVYLCYGIHHLFNIVTNKEGLADAILIRALEPVAGLEIMRERTNKKTEDSRLASGPGLVGKAMGFDTSLTGSYLNENIFIGEKRVKEEIVICSATRIGVDYAGEDAKLPWRFYEVGSPFVSRQ